MANVCIVGDGPAGMSAALLLAKNGMDVVVFGEDGTPMHKAMLYNYLGIPAMTGSEFQEVARHQVESFGGVIEEKKVERIERGSGGFIVTTAPGDTREAKYLVLAAGTDLQLAEDLGLEKGESGIKADWSGKTGVDRLYVVGWSTRLKKTQAIISAGQGAAAALEILSEEEGKDFHDFDVVKN